MSYMPSGANHIQKYSLKMYRKRARPQRKPGHDNNQEQETDRCQKRKKKALRIIVKKKQLTSEKTNVMVAEGKKLDYKLR